MATPPIDRSIELIDRVMSKIIVITLESKKDTWRWQQLTEARWALEELKELLNVQ